MFDLESTIAVIVYSKTLRKYVTGLQRYKHNDLNYVRGTFMFVLKPYGVCP
jgi:hypothetical protein